MFTRAQRGKFFVHRRKNQRKMYSHHGLCNVQALRKMYRHCARAREMYRHLRARAQNVQALQEKSENSSTPPLRLIFGRALMEEH